MGGMLNRLALSVGLIVMALGAVVYYCPVIKTSVEPGYPDSSSFGGWTWREIGPENAGMYPNVTQEFSYPYREPGMVFFLGGLFCFLSTIAYNPVKKLLKREQASLEKIEG